MVVFFLEKVEFFNNKKGYILFGIVFVDNKLVYKVLLFYRRGFMKGLLKKKWVFIWLVLGIIVVSCFVLSGEV